VSGVSREYAHGGLDRKCHRPCCGAPAVECDEESNAQQSALLLGVDPTLGWTNNLSEGYDPMNLQLQQQSLTDIAEKLISDAPPFTWEKLAVQ